MGSWKASSKNNGAWIVWTIILTLVLCTIIVASICIVRYSIANGASVAVNTFQTSFQASESEAYTTLHDEAYQYAEAANHVSNRVTIKIDEIKNKAALEVLRISDVVYVIENGENTKGTVSWLKAYGTGVFTVDLKAAEFVVDNERHSVLIRVPNPELSADIDKLTPIRYSENTWKIDNSIKSGEKLALEQAKEAKQKMQEDFEGNEQYAKLAKMSANSMLTTLIRCANPKVEDLQVEVEFYD